MLDTFDRRILAALQRNNRQSMASIGRDVGLSEPSVRRRISALRAEGYVIADVSLINPDKLGVSVIVSIRFEKESHNTYTAFKKQILADDHITQCYTVTGDEDFILIGYFSTMAHYDDWVSAHLLSNPAISRSTTHVVYQRVKYETAVPLDASN
ncbi:MAG: Lrp/AsnC family transcriptional regulator [Pseudomonadota bacterium]